MKTIYHARSLAWTLLALMGTLFLAVFADASQGDFYSTDQVKVIAHLPLNGKATRQMFLQQDGRKQYLYVRQASQQGFTAVDVTKPAHPKVVNRQPDQNLTMLDSQLALAETPDNSPDASSHMLGNAEGTRGGGTAPESVRLVDESDPAHPRTVQTFDGVTNLVRDNARNLIYVANGDGVWILSYQQVLRRHMCSSSDAISAAIPNCD